MSLETVEKRQKFFELNRKRLEELAYRALYVLKMNPEDFIIVCIEVDDPNWTGLADHLMPDYDWQKIRDRGEIPVARGSVHASVREFIKEVVPDIAEALYRKLPDGYVRAVVMGIGGASVYFIQPTIDSKYN